MKRFLLIGFIFASAGFLSAAAPSGYTYYSGGVSSNMLLPKSQIAYIRQMLDLLHGRDFNFVARKDSRHWIGIGTEKGSAMIYIHDESSKFNCRAAVNLSTGRLTIIKGVAYKGGNRQGNADATAKAASAYFSRVISGEAVFPVSVESPSSAAFRRSKKHSAAAPAKADSISPERPAGISPLGKLKQGNGRFVSGKAVHPNQNGERRTELLNGQHPFAVIVSCSDSRVPPEVIFDQGMGDLFVVRTAGEVVQTVELGSIEYAAEHLHSPLIVVLGHKKCGAVAAAIQGGDMPDNIRAIADIIRPAVDKAKEKKGDILDTAVRENMSNMADRIGGAPVIRHLLEENKVTIVKGYYDLETGKVEFQE